MPKKASTWKFFYSTVWDLWCIAITSENALSKALTDHVLSSFLAALVLVSSLLSKNESSATVQIVLQLLSGRITPIYSSEIIAEYREVLSRKKFTFPIEQVNYLLGSIEKFGIRAFRKEYHDLRLPD